MLRRCRTGLTPYNASSSIRRQGLSTEHALRFGDVVAAADHLTFEEQEELIEIVRNRMIAKRRGELLLDINDAEREQDQCAVITANETVKRLLISSAFQRAAKRLSTKGVLTKEVYAETLHLLEQDVLHPRLKTHKLEGEFEGHWA